MLHQYSNYTYKISLMTWNSIQEYNEEIQFGKWPLKESNKSIISCNKKSRMSLVPQHIQQLKSYKPGRSIEEVRLELGLDKIIKLSSNENPFGASPKALEAVKDTEKLTKFLELTSVRKLSAAN